MNVYIYARVSSEKQAEKNLSISSQLRLVRDYAAKHDMKIIKEYIDEAESARSDNRPAFLKMISDAKNNSQDISAILVWKLSRFARNREDSILYKSLLKKRNIHVISVSEPVDDSPTGILLEGMIETIDEFYSNLLSQEVLRGMIENARRGYRGGGNAPYGYQNLRIHDEKGNPKSKLAVLEDEAKVLKIMFDMYIKGNGLNTIRSYLNENGYKPRTVKHWTKTILSSILKNHACIGWTIFNKKDKKIIGKKLKPESEWIIVKNTHPAIIDETLFNKVQKLMKSRDPKVTNGSITSSKYMLSGLMKCGKCGAPYNISDYGKHKAYAYYNCATYTRKGRNICCGRRLQADELEKTILDNVENKIFSDENMKKLVKDVNNIISHLKGNYSKEISKLKHELGHLQARLNKQYEAIESGDIDIKLVSDRLIELKEQQKKKFMELHNYEELSKNNAVMPINKQILNKFKQEMTDIFVGNNPQEKREFLKKFIEKIEVHEKKIGIFYYAPNSYGIGVNPGVFQKKNVPTTVGSWLLTLDGKLTSDIDAITLLVRMYKYRGKGIKVVFGEPLPPKPAPPPKPARKNIAAKALKVQDFLAEDPCRTYIHASEEFGITKARVCQLMKIANGFPINFLEKMRKCNDQNVLKSFSGKKLLKLANYKTKKEQIHEIEALNSRF